MEAIRQALPEIFSHAAEEHPLECVGLVWSDGSITRLINQSRSTQEFSVGRTQLADKLALVDPDMKTLIAVYHSHPGGTTDLSYEDQQSLKHQYLDGLHLPWVVVTPEETAVWEWNVLDGVPQGGVLENV